jgi:hypothetical protein
MAKVDLYHPELDRLISVSPQAAGVLQRSGWVAASTQPPAEDYAADAVETGETRERDEFGRFTSEREEDS